MVTAHCIVKNEENFIDSVIRAVVNFVDAVIIFDTGSSDQTITKISQLVKEFPDKIIFEEKGICDKKRHTELRQEMLERTKTAWFMILDGDEVWTRRGLEEALEMIKNNQQVECLIAPFYLCVGDLGHTTRQKGGFELLGQKGAFSPRFIKIAKGVIWSGNYSSDQLLDRDGKTFFKETNCYFLKNKYWHLTHLRRSSLDDIDYSSGGTRKEKRRETYTVIGKKINEPLPDVFTAEIIKSTKLSFCDSTKGLVKLVAQKFWQARAQFLRYFMTGISALALDILSLYFFKEYFGVRPVIIVIINQAVLTNYVFLINKYWSFAARGMGHQQIVRFYLLSGANYIFSIFWMWIMNEHLGLNYLLARLANIAMAVGWNFLLYKHWVYKQNGL